MTFLTRTDTPNTEATHLEALQRLRVVSIVQHNPWTAGEIRLTGSPKEHHITWRAEVSDSDAARHFAVVDAELPCSFWGKADEKESYDALCAVLEEAMGRGLVQNGFKTAPLFFVALLRVVHEGETRYAQIVHTNHGISDGATFYALRNMLSDTVPITRLDTTRVMHCESDMVRTYHPRSPAGTYLVEVMWPIFFRGVVSLLAGPLLPLSHGVFLINDDEILRRKEASKARPSKVEYISTSDIITSWWWGRFPLSMPSRKMVVNLRGRVAVLGHMHAGNNVTSLNVDATKEAITPEAIRATLINGNKGVCREPSFWEHLSGTEMMVSNWSTFHTQMSCGGYTETRHYPMTQRVHAGSFCILFADGAGGRGVSLDRDPFSPAQDFSKEALLKRVMAP